MNFQFAIYVIHADVTVSQFRLICTASDIQCLVQFLSDNFSGISLTIITSIFHAVISSCHFMFIVVFIFIYDTSDTVSTIFTVYTVLAVSTFNSKTVFAVFTIEANGAIFTVDYNSRTIFTIYTDRTIFAWFTIFTVMTKFNIVSQCISVSVVFRCWIDSLFNSQVFACSVVDCTTVFNSCCSCSAFYFTAVSNCIGFESETIFDLISQSGQVDFRYCTSLICTSTIVVFQCNRFICFIIGIRCSSFTCTIRCSRCNM